MDALSTVLLCVLFVLPSVCHVGDAWSEEGVSPASYTLPDGNRTSSEMKERWGKGFI